MSTELDIFSQISQISNQMKEDAEKKAAQKKKSGGNNKFANADMIFLSNTGAYEFRLLTDSSNKIHEDIFMHTVKTKSGNGATVVCKDPETCEICKRIKTLKDHKYPEVWKYYRRASKKILIKTGKFPNGPIKGMTENKVYIAYVDPSYFKALIEALNLGQQYYKDDLLKMMDIKNPSGGFLANVSRADKKTNYNISFIPQMTIEGDNPETVFGAEKYYITNLGYFKNSYIPEDKLKQCTGILDTLILEVAKNAAKKEEAKPVDPTPAEPNKTEPVKEESPAEPEKIDVVNEEVKVETPPATPETTSESDNATPELNPDKLGADGKPECFGFCDLNSSICRACPSKKACVSEAVAMERL